MGAMVTPSRLELLTPHWKCGDLNRFVEGAMVVCRTGFEPVNRNGAVLQTVCFNHLHTDTYGISGRIRTYDNIRMKDAY